jgi:hypothetical protein
MGVLYILNYIDRQNLAAAKLQGIMEDLNMTNQQFATAISILFVGYLPFQLPSNLIISRLTRPGLCECDISPRSNDEIADNRHLLRLYDLGLYLCLYRNCADLRGVARRSCIARRERGRVLPRGVSSGWRSAVGIEPKS